MQPTDDNVAGFWGDEISLPPIFYRIFKGFTRIAKTPYRVIVFIILKENTLATIVCVCFYNIFKTFIMRNFYEKLANPFYF